ncbi:MAG: integration host factor subunit beta [Bacteroidetes bacterium]|nr:integration host factor subunit beta [Bacteroidota bacterium]
MTKADIVEKIAAGTGLTKLETEAIVEGFLNTVIQSLRDGNGIEIRGFGSYKVKKKNSRYARNPRTGEQVFVDEHYVPVFKFSKDFKQAVDEGMKESEKNSVKSIMMKEND